MKKNIGSLCISILFFISTFAQVNCIDVRSYGVIPNSSGDCSDSLQNAINQASALGGTLCFPPGIYKFSQTLTIPDGVSFKGSGMGSNALTTPYNGTVLWYNGSSKACQVTGTNVSFAELTLYNYGGNATTGFEVFASAKIVESVNLTKVQIYGFTSGTALCLKASNSGGIAYGSFYDLRIRHAKTGIEINETDANSFVNSNSFFHGVISGGGFQNALLINGGNNNVFYSTVIEPPSSTDCHILVNKGQIIGENIRVEASSQTSGNPVIKFASAASQSRITGLYGGGVIINEGNNCVELASSNALGEQNSNINLFQNSALMILTKGSMPEFWTLSNSNAVFAEGSQEIIAGQKTLSLKIPPGQVCEMYPQTSFSPVLTGYSTYKYANLSALVKCSEAGKVKLTYNYSGGVVSSVAHTGGGNWETIGLQALTDVSIAPNPKIHLDNSAGQDTLFAEISSPVFCFGQNVPSRDVKPIGSNGGILSGLISTGVSNNYTFISGTTYLVLSKIANTFIISGTSLTITRLNHLTADRFPKGSIVILLMNNSGINVVNSAYITLRSAYTSSSGNSSLTLMSNGDGTWREVNRNN